MTSVPSVADILPVCRFVARWNELESKARSARGDAPVPTLRRFRLRGAYGTGHINDTYCAVFDQGGIRVRYIVQRINQHVFKNPPALMENVRRVTAHLAENPPADRIRSAACSR